MGIADPIRRLRHRWVERRTSSWLRGVRNLVHVGANTGQEAELYDRYGLGVLWIEPIPSVYARLVEHVKPFSKQATHNALVTDIAGKKHTLRISNNDGASSSILSLAEHKAIWTDIELGDGIEIVSETLDDILSRDPRDYDALVMSTQGAELMVLKGSTRHLPQLRFIKTRLPDFNSYEGGATLGDVASFLEARGFSELRRDVFATKPDRSGTYFDIVFTSSRNPPPSPRSTSPGPRTS